MVTYFPKRDILLFPSVLKRDQERAWHIHILLYLLDNHYLSVSCFSLTLQFLRSTKILLLICIPRSEKHMFHKHRINLIFPNKEFLKSEGFVPLGTQNRMGLLRLLSLCKTGGKKGLVSELQKLFNSKI